MKRKIFSILFAVALVAGLGLVTAVPAAADVIDVSPGDSIQAAIDGAQPGDTVNVAAGTYYEKIIMKDGVTLEGAGPGESIIDGTESLLSGNRHGVVNFYELDGTSAVKGFSIMHKGADYTAGYPGSMTNHGIHIQGGSGTFIIENNDISAAKGKGILISGGYQNVLIKNNVIAHDGHPAPGITAGSFEGIEVMWHATVEIINNVVYGWGRQGIRQNQYATLDVKNTIVSNCGAGIFTKNAPNLVDVSYSAVYDVTDVWGGAWPTYWFGTGVDIGDGVIDNHLSHSPGASGEYEEILFQNPTDDPETWDFGLQDESPCKGTGENGTNMGLTPPPPPMVPMASFVIDHAKLDFKKKADDDKVRVKGKLALDPNGEVNISDDVIVTVGPLSETITMDLKGKKGEKWQYKRAKGDEGNIKKMTINWKNGKFDIRMDKADLSELTDPQVTISVQIGDDIGSASILMRVKKHHWDYKAPK